jgi:glycosyltransferase involved in cell wall biosynthesis
VRILFAYKTTSRFVEIDRDLLAERWDVSEWAQPGRITDLFRLVSAVRRSDLVFAWFASWPNVFPLALARVFGKPTVLVVGGFDTASEPEIGYGYQRGGVRGRMSAWLMRHATRLMTNSFSSRAEIERNVGLPSQRIEVVYHGVPDEFGSPEPLEREAVVLTAGNIARISLARKGYPTFLGAAALLPEVSFVLAGGWLDESAERLRSEAPANVVLTGALPREELVSRFRSASVYVQASRHEGFGMALAEAMLAGCIPVVTTAGALPEVVGDVGVTVAPDDAQALADGIRTALELGPDERRRARERILREFPVESRRDGLFRIVESALGG